MGEDFCTWLRVQKPVYEGSWMVEGRVGIPRGCLEDGAVESRS